MQVENSVGTSDLMRDWRSLSNGKNNIGVCDLQSASVINGCYSDVPVAVKFGKRLMRGTADVYLQHGTKEVSLGKAAWNKGFYYSSEWPEAFAAIDFHKAPTFPDHINDIRFDLSADLELSEATFSLALIGFRGGRQICYGCAQKFLSKFNVLDCGSSVSP